MSKSTQFSVVLYMDNDILLLDSITSYCIELKK